MNCLIHRKNRPPMTTRSPFIPLLALAVGAFGIGTTEFSPMGLLPVIASGVNVSIATAGLLVSAYAVGVMVGAPFVTLGFARTRARTALIVLMAIFTLGNLLSAIAPGYATLLASRVVTSMAHGAFFGIGATVAAGLVPVSKRASAVATMFAGLTIANIGGVPLVTWLGQTAGWRVVFVCIAAIGVVAMLAVAFALPREKDLPQPGAWRDELRVIRSGPVLNALATTVVGASAMFALYTYVAPFLKDVTQAGPGFVTGMLVVIGLGFTIGNHLGGKFADRSIDKTLFFFLGLLALILLVMPVLARTHVGAAIGMLVFGIASFALVPPVQMRVMHAAADAPGLASSVNIGAFNLGNAIGAAAGSVMIDAGFSYAAVPVSGTAAALLGIVLVWWGRRFAKA
jgi:DHA1 family inner membrane transport protein